MSRISFNGILPFSDMDEKEEEEPQTPPAVSDPINDRKDGSHSSTDLIEK